MTSVQRLFNNIKKLVPNYFDDCVGYTKQELEDFEKTLGFKLPDAVKEFYGTMKECDALGYSWGNISLEFGMSNIYGLAHLYSYPADKVKIYPFNIKKNIQIIYDGGGSGVRLDFDPDTEGTFGQLLLTFRDYPEIAFCIAKDFNEYVDFLNGEFENNGVTVTKEGYLMFGNNVGYHSWVDLSHKNTPKNASNKLVNLSDVWIRSISNNREFLGKPLSEMVESDLDRIYYVDLFEENLDSIEVLALFPNIAKIIIGYISTDILEILAKTRVAMLNVYVEIIDFKQLVSLKHLVDMTISCKTIKNIEYIAEFKHLKSLTIRADFTSEQEQFYQNYKETNNISESLYD